MKSVQLILFHSRYKQFLLQAALQSRAFHTLTLRLLINRDSIFDPNPIEARSFLNVYRDFIILLTMKEKNQYGRRVTRCYPCVSLGMCLIFCMAPRSGSAIHVNCFWGEFPSRPGALPNNSHSTNARQTLARAAHCYPRLCSSATILVYCAVI